jgi:hypothetical protein
VAWVVATGRLRGAKTYVERLQGVEGLWVLGRGLVFIGLLAVYAGLA